MGRPKPSANSPVKRRNKKVKDANKPKRSTSAYFYFLSHCRALAAKEGRSISKIAEFTKECSVKWRALTVPDKIPFEEKAGVDKERYATQMAAYKGTTAPDPNKPKRPQSAYFCFLGGFRKKMAGTDVGHKDLLRLAGEEWRGLTASDKKPYEKLSQIEHQKYDVAMAEYKKTGGAPPKPAPPPPAKNGKSEEENEDEEEEDMEEDEEDDESDED